MIDERTVSIADYYWKYAALASYVYISGGRIDSRAEIYASSPWLRRELKNENERRRFESLLEQRRKKDASLRTRRSRCSSEKIERASLEERAGGFADDFDDCIEQKAVEPMEDKDCEYKDGKEPFVPVEHAIGLYGWERVPELHRQFHPRGWSFFFPGLAIDVWRRKIAPPDAESLVVEYALVYRGTEENGGMLSNLRVLTSLTPLMWDQYRQARVATRDLVKQIYGLHEFHDEIVAGQRTTVRVTAVGHSLGGGIAVYVLLRVPGIQKAIGFDPSPVDGSMIFNPFVAGHYDDKREWEAHARGAGVGEEPASSGSPGGDWCFGNAWKLDQGQDTRAVVRRRFCEGISEDDDRRSDTAIDLLYEDGEALTRIAACTPGPIWGSDGGPIVRCESVDLSHNNWIAQHNMAQLACRLYLVKTGRLAVNEGTTK